MGTYLLRCVYEKIANVGFPIAVATYLLVRVESKLSMLTESINKLSSSIINIK
ncbi:MAG: YvrJ family protein [Dethiosulfatibacter sp.]|nr:YvrJ family protein [Dethiosulfatibacter sp.]